MGTYEKSYCVDGVIYELYRQTDIYGEFIGYELVTQRGRKINDGLLGKVPTHRDVVALVRERVRRHGNPESGRGGSK